MNALDTTKLGTSQIPAIVNVDRYVKPFGVYAQIVHGYSSDAGEPAEWGTRLEPVILEAFAERRGLDAFKPQTRYPPGRPWSRVSVDSLALPAMHLECKAIGEWRWRDEADEWGEDGSAKVPDRLRVQVTAQLEWMRSEPDFWRENYNVDPLTIDASHVVVLVGGNNLRWFRVPYDPELGGLLYESAARFVRDYVEPKRWPPADDSDACSDFIRRTFPKAEGAIRPATSREQLLCQDIHHLGLDIKAIEETKDALENELRLAIGADLGIEGPGFKATHSNRAGSTNWKTVAHAIYDEWESEEDPPKRNLADYAAKYKSEGSRTLSVKFGGEK